MMKWNNGYRADIGSFFNTCIMDTPLAERKNETIGGFQIQKYKFREHKKGTW